MATVTEFNPSACTDNEEKNTEYLTLALEEDDPGVLLAAIGHVTKARGMSVIAEDRGLGRHSPYKAFPSGATPRFETLQKDLGSPGVKINVWHPDTSRLQGCFAQGSCNRRPCLER